MRDSRKNVLYISYDGILEPLGQSQVMQYLLKLSGHFQITLMSFEKKQDWQQHAKVTALHARLQDAGIHWVPLRYHKSPSAPATLFDVMQGIAVAAFRQAKTPFQIVHARSYVASLIGWSVSKLFGSAFIFDMRGFWADEKVDSKAWERDSLMYRITKKLETYFLRSADVIVSLTHAGVDELRKFPALKDRSPQFEVISTCANLDLFCVNDSTVSKPFTIGYVGSVGLWYDFDRVARCYRLVLNDLPETRFLIVNRDAHAEVRSKLLAHGVPESSFRIVAAEHAEVPGLMAKMDATAFFIRPSFSKKASAPTKLAEFLGCGVPVLTNSGVGDMDFLVEKEAVGILVPSADQSGDTTAVRRWIALTKNSQTKQQCREVALRYFSLAQGVFSYRRIYDGLLSQENPG